MTDNDEFKYEIIDNENDAIACAQLIAEELAANNPFTIFHKVTPKYVFEKCSWPIMKDVLEEKLSFLVRHRSSGEIVGALCAGDMYLRHKNHPYSASAPPDAVPGNDLIHEMEDLFVRRDFGQELKPNMVLYIMLAAVRSQYANKGITSHLSMVVTVHAEDTKGFQYSLVQTTNPAARNITVNKMGGKEVTVIDPTTWQWKKKGEGSFYPYKDYKGGPIPNILTKF